MTEKRCMMCKGERPPVERLYCEPCHRALEAEHWSAVTLSAIDGVLLELKGCADYADDVRMYAHTNTDPVLRVFARRGLLRKLEPNEPGNGSVPTYVLTRKGVRFARLLNEKPDADGVVYVLRRVVDLESDRLLGVFTTRKLAEGEADAMIRDLPRWQVFSEWVCDESGAMVRRWDDVAFVVSKEIVR